MSIFNQEVKVGELPEIGVSTASIPKFNPRSNLERFYTVGAVFGSLAGAIGINFGIWIFRPEEINLGMIPFNTFGGLLGGSILGFGTSCLLANACEKIVNRIKS